MIKILKNYLKKIYISSEPDKYDAKHFGTFSFWRLLLINLISPGRTLNRFKYGQTWKNKNKIIKNFEKNIQSEDKSSLSKALSDFISNGVVVIDKYFSEDKINNFVKENQLIIDELKNFKSGETTYNYSILNITKSLIPLWFDDNLIKLISSYIGRQFYARDYPAIVGTYVPDIENYDSKTGKTANEWHLDHSVFFSVHLLLEDISETDTCMLVLPGTQKLFSHASLYSDKIVKDSNIKPIRCFGKKGTVYIHSGNVVHRLQPVRASNRLELRFDFTAGSNIQLNCENISKCLQSNFDLESLSDIKREIIKGIFPKSLNKGYEFNNESMRPSKYRKI